MKRTYLLFYNVQTDVHPTKPVRKETKKNEIEEIFVVNVSINQSLEHITLHISGFFPAFVKFFLSLLKFALLLFQSFALPSTVPT